MNNCYHMNHCNHLGSKNKVVIIEVPKFTMLTMLAGSVNGAMLENKQYLLISTEHLIPAELLVYNCLYIDRSCQFFLGHLYMT